MKRGTDGGVSGRIDARIGACGNRIFSRREVRIPSLKSGESSILDGAAFCLRASEPWALFRQKSDEKQAPV